MNGISKITPSFVSAGKVVSSTQATSLVYIAVIPAGATLAKTSNLASVTNTVGNVAYINQASTTSALIRSAQAFGAVASVMAVASIIVGQYYMMQINSNLKELNLGISNIISFQNAEYRSRVMSLISHIKTLADFQVENLNEEELRNSALIELSTLENECTKLLGQAGEAINNIIDKDYDDFPLYEKEVEEIQRWSTYQETLFSLLDRIADLKYVFHLGKMSREQCDSLVGSYSKQIDEMKVRLNQWQNKEIEYFAIDLSNKRRKRKGADKATHLLPSLWNKDKQYRSVNDKTIVLISDQLEGPKEKQEIKDDLFSKDVELISKEGKVYLLVDEEKKD